MRIQHESVCVCIFVVLKSLENVEQRCSKMHFLLTFAWMQWIRASHKTDISPFIINLPEEVENAFTTK